MSLDHSMMARRTSRQFVDSSKNLATQAQYLKHSMSCSVKHAATARNSSSTERSPENLFNAISRAGPSREE
jgi:hypothetical protein